MAIKDSLGGISWLEWDDKLKLRDKKTLLKYSKKLEEEITFYKYIQYLFSDQNSFSKLNLISLRSSPFDFTYSRSTLNLP